MCWHLKVKRNYKLPLHPQVTWGFIKKNVITKLACFEDIYLLVCSKDYVKVVPAAGPSE